MRLFIRIIIALALVAFSCQFALAEDDEPGPVEMEWAGHLKLYGRALFPQSGTAFDDVGLGTNFDGQLEFRLNNKIFFGDLAYTELHWEAVAASGETRKDGEKLRKLYPALFPNGMFSPPSDDRRLLDLTGVVHESRDTMIYHRLDRAMLAFQPEWGEIRLGRQAVTWGHGFTFNPLDLFNPFSPIDLERDYKMGDDIAFIHLPATDFDMEMIYVARRDPISRHADFEQASIGTKLNFTLGETDLDVVLARHYEDYIAGVGAVGYLGDAGWRVDLMGTFLDKTSRGRSVYLSGVANLDYSWNWFGKNWYGYLELYYNGLSDDDYSDHFYDRAILDRIVRGELFALGSLYLSGNVNIELHPLVNFYLTPIVNLKDPSGILLPRVVYDMAEDVRLTLTGAYHWGDKGTEYGGYDIPNFNFGQKPSDTVSAWLTWYF